MNDSNNTNETNWSILPERQSLAIALAKDIQTKSESLGLYLETGDHHQPQPNKEQMLKGGLVPSASDKQKELQGKDFCERCRKLEGELNSVKNESATIKVQLVDVRDKVVQIRKIARKYKDLYFNLKSKIQDGLEIVESIERKSNVESVVEIGELDSSTNPIIQPDNERKRRREPGDVDKDRTNNKLIC